MKIGGSNYLFTGVTAWHPIEPPDTFQGLLLRLDKCLLVQSHYKPKEEA